jgi:UPF0755 protein
MSDAEHMAPADRQVPPDRPVQPPRRRLRFGLALAVMVVLTALTAGAAVVYLYAQATRPFQGYTEPEQFVEVPAGAGAQVIARRLAEHGVIVDPRIFRLVVRLQADPRRLRAGEYRFDSPMSTVDVVRKLAAGDIYLHRITFAEGLTIEEKARVFEARGFGPASTFVEAARNPAPVAHLDPEAPDLEGYLFPDTYAVPRKTTAEQMVRVMVNRFEQVFGPDLRAKAEAGGLTVRQVVTFASIIEKETGRPEERPLVSAVFNNRLRLGMRLQTDPTVIYALQREGLYQGNLTRRGLAFDSPYNTYVYGGLPPGPIAAPGRASLEAVFQPAEADYLYFVSRNDGSHVFSRTLQEHNRAVQRWQIDYFREKRQARD